MHETATQQLHRLTSYQTGREWDEPIDHPDTPTGLPINEIELIPWFHKRYPDSLPRIALPKTWKTATADAIESLAGVTPKDGAVPLDLAQLGRLLHLSAGVVRTMQRPYGTYLFRAAGSAGGRFPLEFYLAVPLGHALPAGVHWYDPSAHELVTVGAPPSAGAGLIVTGIPWRTGWRYRERGYRHIYWDAGSSLAQTLSAGDAHGFGLELYTDFPDDAVNALVGANGVHEFAVAVMGFGNDTIQSAHSVSAFGEVDAHPYEFPLITTAQRAGNRDTYGESLSRGQVVDIGATRCGRSIDDLILARGSHRRLDPQGALSLDVLDVSMRLATRGTTLDHYIAAHDISSLEPGVYTWPNLATPMHRGNIRSTLYTLALEQGLAEDASFVTMSTTDVSLLDDRAYRRAHLESGLVSGRLHLAAYAMGAAASGMTFLDVETKQLLGGHTDPLLFTCVGVPLYPSATGGMPGAPTEVRRVEAR